MTDKNNNQPIMILGQFVKDLSFEHPDPLFSLNIPADKQPDMNVDVAINTKPAEQEGLYEVTLGVNVSAKAADKTMFLLELSYSAFVQVDMQAVEKDQLNPVLMINVPHMLFPFVRGIIYNTVREGGLPPLMLNPIDFAAMYEANLQKDKPSSSKESA
ncbi:MAG: protein-export chaperone SecB [Alphaproteobacteria bacterium CG_4_10_14_0_8_um_filter_37_21]|nr:MAG: protein-export chaperone SecB [Alphaproteobacteria bacterium CG_4_10_14_0_8_um_filter_37_21]